MATMMASNSTTPHSDKLAQAQSASTAASASRYQQLKTRKVDLEKKLNEKYTQLQSIMREEAQLTGIYPNDFNVTSTNANEPSSSQALRRKVGTSFKLPENLLNHNEDDINKLLLEKQIQQQISEASLRLSSDSSQTKSIRRTHKQNYEAAQQKIMTIDQNLSLMKKRQQHQQNPKKMTQDDINLHKNSRMVKNSGNLMVQTGNSQTLNCNSSVNMYMERRNSMKSVSSNNTFIIHGSPGNAEAMTNPLRTSQNVLTTIRTRHDSFSNNSGNHFEYDGQHSPTMSHYSMQIQQQMRHSKGMKIRPDQSYSPNHNPQYHYHTYSPNYPTQSQESPHQNYVQRHHNTSYQYSPQLQHQHQMTLSPQQSQYVQDLLLTTSVHPNGHQYHHEYSRISHNFSDDMKENSHQMLLQQHQMRLQKIANQPSPLAQQQSPPHPHQQQQQGLGGFWTLNDNNERVWCTTNDAKYSSLERKAQMQKVKSTSSPNITAKANSMGNFDFMSKHDDFSHDSVSISSANSNDTKKKEKVWCETSLDGPVTTTPKTTRVQATNFRIKPSNSTMSLSPKYLSSQLDNINNNNLVYPTSPTSTKSFPNPNHHNSYRTVSPTHSLQQQPPPPLPPHLYPKNHQLLSARNSVYSNREEEFIPPPSNSELESYYSNIDNHRPPNPPSYPNLPPKAKLKHTESTRSLQNIPDNSSMLHIDVRGDYENNNITGNVSPTPTIMSTSTYIPTHSPSLNLLKSPDLQTESPKNVTVVQQGTIQPYKEITKPFEMSDFYKYSTKFRQQTQSQTNTLQRQEVQIQHHEQTQKTFYQQSSTVYK